MSKKIPPIVSSVRKYKEHKIDYSVEKSISFSQFYTFSSCPHKWKLTYLDKLAPYQPSVHGVFGTAIHETIQHWLEVMYDKSIKEANSVDLDNLLIDRLKKTYKKERFNNSYEDFTTSKELNAFYEDGVNILNFLKKKRDDYFSKKYTYLVGYEIPLVQEVRPKVYFKGYIDLVFYDSFFNRFKIVDLKTSTNGWTEYAKNDESKVAQILLYKEFFSRQYNISKESIEVEFLILKRKLPNNTEFQPKHIQRFTPASGKVKMNKINKMFNDYLDTVFDEDGEYRQLDLEKIPSLNNCRFCPFNSNKNLCEVGIS